MRFCLFGQYPQKTQSHVVGYVGKVVCVGAVTKCTMCCASLQQLQEFISDPVKYELVKSFNLAPDKFDYNVLIQ